MAFLSSAFSCTIYTQKAPIPKNKGFFLHICRRSVVLVASEGRKEQKEGEEDGENGEKCAALEVFHHFVVEDGGVNDIDDGHGKEQSVPVAVEDDFRRHGQIHDGNNGQDAGKARFGEKFPPGDDGNDADAGKERRVRRGGVRKLIHIVHDFIL